MSCCRLDRCTHGGCHGASRYFWNADRIAVNLFASGIQPLTHGFIPAAGDEAKSMAKALFAHKPSGGTEFTDAFRQTIDQARGAMRPVIVIITDGQISPFTLVTGSAPCSPAPPISSRQRKSPIVVCWQASP